jgi:PadR family transcriptional regulator, regulatory protein PadR
MTVPHADLLQGTLDLLILKSLSLQPMHGWGVAQRIQQLSRDALVVNQGSLYPALHKLEREGLIQSQWGASENNRRAKYYSLTPAGERELADDLGRWERFTSAIALVLQTN